MRLIFVLGAMLWLMGCAAATDGGGQTTVRRVLNYPVDAGCHAVPIPKITANLFTTEPVVDRSLGYRDLSEKAADSWGSSVKGHATTFGATASKINGYRVFDIDDVQLADGRACLWMTQAKLVTTWEIRIDIAREIQSGSCPDRVVRAHEAQHAALDQRLQPLLVQAIKTVLIEHGRVSILASSVAVGQQQLHQILTKMVVDTMANFILDRNAQQIAIDTPAEYARVKGLCDQSAWAKLIR